MTTKAELADWFDRGISEGATHMIVVCDTFDHEDYPVFAHGVDDVLEKHAGYDGKNMQRVMEVYDLRLNKVIQLAERQALHLPLKS